MSAAEIIVAPSSTKPPAAKHRQRWFQFSLRALLIAMVALSVLFGAFAWRLQRAKNQAAAAATIRAQGGTVVYDFAMRKDAHGMYEYKPGTTVSLVPARLRQLFGDDFFYEVYAVYRAENSPATQREMDSAWDAIGTFPHLKMLVISGRGWRVRGTSLSPGIMKLAKTPELQNLVIDHGRMEVQDLKVLGGLLHLQELKVWEVEFDDAALEGLTGLQELRVLDIRAPKASLRGAIAISQLRNLEELALPTCSLGDDDMVPFGNLSKLQWLDVRGTEVTSVGAAQLMKCMPHCSVMFSPPQAKSK